MMNAPHVVIGASPTKWSSLPADVKGNSVEYVTSAAWTKTQQSAEITTIPCEPPIPHIILI